MPHFFLTKGTTPASWREAFPEACVSASPDQESMTDGIVWYRLRLDEEVESAVATVRQSCTLPLVVMSDQPGAGEVVRVIAAGAVGYCNTHAAPEVLRQIALVVANGGFWVGQAYLQHLVGGAARLLTTPARSNANDWIGNLSEREQEVARRVAAGASNREIAEALGITERTVKAHLGAIFEKLGVRDRLQLSLRVNGIQS